MVSLLNRSNEQVTAQVYSALRTRQAMNLTDLVHSVDARKRDVIATLKRGMDQDSIECLRPISRSQPRGASDAAMDAPDVFYRWRRPNDRKYIWQTRMPLREDHSLPCI